MDKDFNLKNDPRYQSTHLRERITKSIKRICDDVKEVKEQQAMNLWKRGGTREFKENKGD